ncbi:MAG: hypothetical protein Q7T30_03720 [Planctomycetota bacterium]|nr:hypothetical protein [Planctomycetota bacterium]
MTSALRSAAIATLLLSPFVTCQVPIPPHANPYTGFSRGFHFTANTNFNIVQLGLPLDAFVAGDTAGFLVRVNGAVVLHSIGNVGPAIVTSIPVALGDVVDVIGNWSPAVPGTLTAHNSYSASMVSFATTIEGVAHTLVRTGWQWDIGAAGYAAGSYLAPTTGQIGRVSMYTSPGGSVFATATPYGAGCVANYTSFYEHFAGAHDLGNSAMTMVKNATGYTVRTGVTTYRAPSGTATVLTLTDDSQVAVALSAAMPVAGGTTSNLTVCSNGFVSVASGNGMPITPGAAVTLAAPQTAWWCHHDYNPAIVGGGRVKFEEAAGVAYVTWDGVWDYLGTTAANANTFQFQFELATGNVHFVWGTMSGLGNGHLVGYSPGGASADPGNRDLSATLPAAFPVGATDQAPLLLTINQRPIVNTTIHLTTSNITPTTPFGAVAFGIVPFGVPFDLAALGMAGCFQYHDVLATFLYLPLGASSVSTPWNVPNMVGLHIQAQSYNYDPAAGLTTIGAVSSRAYDLLLGDW